MKIISAEQAATMIKDNSNVGIGGFGAFGVPEYLLKTLRHRYQETKSPSNLTVVCGISPGDLKEDGGGLTHLKAPGLIGSIIAAHIGMPPSISKAVAANQIAGYMLPLGIITNLLRASAGNRPGVISKVGLYTFADPRQEGCRVNEKARASGKELVELIHIKNEEFLFYHSFPLDFCLIRGTLADESGNISLKEEAVISEALEMAMAVHNNGGKVIVQVRKIVQTGSIPPKEILIHGSCVDYVVVSPEVDHPQGLDNPNTFRAEISGSMKIPVSSIPPLPMSVRKVIARRAAMELKNNTMVNLGIGIPSEIANIANEENLTANLAVESGLFGGVPVGGAGLGASVNPEAFYHIADNFDYYDGGGLDMTFLGAAQIDENGNVNVSRFGTHCTGPGGFINITQSTKEVFFLSTFTAGDAKYNIQNGELKIVKDASHAKFIKKVEQITFSAEYAKKSNKKIRYITERAVFALTADGLELIEIAPGIDLERDVLGKMDFTPKISDRLTLMDKRIFLDEPMNL